MGRRRQGRLTSAGYEHPLFDPYCNAGRFPEEVEDWWGDVAPASVARRPVLGEWDDPTWIAAEFDPAVYADLLEKDDLARHSDGTSEAWVYYCLRHGLIKIGCSASPRMRVRAFGAALLAVEWGGFPLEMHRHWEFASDHRGGEWFTDTPRLRAHIASLGDVDAALEPENQAATA